ncbi:DNA polymerase beta palm domain-containing protein [Sarocladium implicatum]|nr:DNA polymerase beta palm domain-containing protein [Sarocladium implicatum]
MDAPDDLAELQSKAAFFQQLAANLEDDELDPQEAADRQLRRRLFRATQSPSAPGDGRPRSSPAATTVRQVSGSHAARSRAGEGVGANTKHVTIKGTPANVNLRRGRVSAFLDDGDGDDETVIPDSAKPVNKVLQRSNSTPLPQLKRINSNSRQQQPRQPTKPGDLSSSFSETNMASSRKRQKKSQSADTAPKIRPPEQQVFRGLSFFYIPDNDIAPVRRMRIKKAREFGAIWTRSVGSASHVIVEKALDWKAVQGFLMQRNAMATGGSSSVQPAVVNEDYPVDCIQFGKMLDHEQGKYRVTGQPSSAPAATSNIDEASEARERPKNSSDTGALESLQLKAPPTNPRRWDYVPRPGTPSRSGESSLAGQEVVPDSFEEHHDGGNAIVIVESPPASPSVNLCKALTEDRDPATPSEQNPAKIQPKDELSDMISAVAEYKDLPVDLEDNQEDETGQTLEEEAEQSDSDAEQVQDGSSENIMPQVGGRFRKRLGFEERFACNQAGAKEAKLDNPNARTIEVLQKMADYYNRTNDHWRTTSYRKAISTLKRQTQRIATEDEAYRLPSIGRRLAQKIEEIVTTDSLQRLEYAQQEPMTESLQLFMGIYGVGNSLAQQWIAQGYRTLDDLVAKAKLTPNQRLGIEHYDDLNKRIPRVEMDELGKLVKGMARQIDPAVELIIGGSYRRGAESSGDIDFIITREGTSSTAELMPFLQELVQRLEEKGILVARLASSRSEGDGSKWHGCCVLPFTPGIHNNDDDASTAGVSATHDTRFQYRAIWRRIDFLLVPATERGAALLYFTGNDIFNRSMRLLASRKGMRLNQRGLYRDVMRGPSREKLSEGELVEGRDERVIFEVLGVRWREPHERWC